MPAKAMCPNCGAKMRGAAHLCDPVKVKAEKKRQGALLKLQGK